MQENTQIQVSSTQQQAIEKFNERLKQLAEETKIKIVDQASLAASGNTKISLQSYIKSVETAFADELGPLEERVKRLKLTKAGLISPAKLWLDGLVDRQRDFMAEEKRRAEAERQRLQAEAERKQREQAEADRREAERVADTKRRQTVAAINADLEAGLIGKREAAKRLKAAGAEQEAAMATAAAVAEEQKNAPPPTVKVAPSIPSAPGIRNQTYYFAEVTDGGNQIINDLVYALLHGDQVRGLFLRQFIEVSEKAVSNYARDQQDDKAVMSVLPGVKAWSKG